jgi:hypothetical protein
MSPVIEVLVSPTGETKLETRGFAGAACQQATKALEAALGLKQSETLTAEFHLSANEEAGVVHQSDASG